MNKILIDINDLPHSDIIWNDKPRTRNQLHCRSTHISPFWNYARRIGYEQACLDLQENSLVWQYEWANDCAKMSRAKSADMYLACDDFGTTRGSMINPATFDKAYMPFLARFTDYCKRNNALSVWHSCGDLRELLPLLARSDVDILWLDELHLMGAIETRKTLGSKKVLWFSPKSTNELIDAYPSWAMVNLKKCEVEGNLDWVLNHTLDMANKANALITYNYEAIA